jgi:hypothetical protein
MGRENGASALSSDPTRALAYTIAKRKGHAASADTWMKQGAASNFAFIEPMNALRVRDLPVGDWLYEVKFDGYRALALKAGKEVRFVSRSTGLNNDYLQVILECQARQLRFGALARARLVYRHRSASLSALVPALCGRS